MLTLVPLGGLCNRLRIVFSAIQAASQTNGGICVEWAANSECHAHFSELFLPVSTGSLRITDRHWWATPSRKRNAYWPCLVRAAMGYRLQRESYVPESADELSSILQSKHKCFISSSSQLCSYSRPCIDRLVPQPDIQHNIDRITAKYVKKTVGVHIRRTDNAAAIAHSPLEAFRRALDNEIRQDFNVRFFLATDDETVKTSLQQEYPDRIIAQHTSVRRDTLQGMKEAVTDLFCLAATRKIIGSYWSSFTDTAAELGNIPLSIAH